MTLAFLATQETIVRRDLLTLEIALATHVVHFLKKESVDEPLSNLTMIKARLIVVLTKTTMPNVRLDIARQRETKRGALTYYESTVLRQEC